MITITSNALTKIREILSEEDEGSKLRTFVQGGGCAGFEYGFSVDKEQNEDDFEIEGTDGLVLIDAMSMQYLNDAVIDYVEDLMEQVLGLKIQMLRPLVDVVAVFQCPMTSFMTIMV